MASGLTAKGQAQRQVLIDATLSVIERDGIIGVTHRNIAKEAKVVPSAAIYYFATIDDLLLAALTKAAGDYAEQLQFLMDSGSDGIDGIAHMISEASTTGKRRAIAERELSLQAARIPSLRPIAKHWRELVAKVASSYTDDPLTIQTVVAVADGICTKVLLSDESTSQEEIRTLLRRIIAK